MKKVGDFVLTPQINHLKKDSLLSLSKEKHIKDFFNQNHLDTSLMEDYWVELLDYNDDYKTCLNCQSLSQCPKDNIGMKKNLILMDGDIVLEVEGCAYTKSWEDKRQLLEKFVVTNVKEEMLLTDLSSLDILKKQNLTPNEKAALAYILKYINFL